MMFATDFADQAVVLPLWLTLGAVLAALGWRRGALAWLAAVGGTLLVVGVAKLLLLSCGPGWLRSPSGHTAAAGVVAGGLAVLAGWRGSRVAGAALAGGALIGATRLALGAHSPAEVLAGGAAGLAGALVLARLAGRRPPGLRLRWLVVTLAVVVTLFHGLRLPAEVVLRGAAARWDVCRRAG
jgi:membrane-associated phospholipid phosphatase